MTDQMTIDGLKDMEKIFKSLLPKEANNLARTMVYDLAVKASKEIKQGAPTGDTGLLVEAIAPKRRKSKRKTEHIADVLSNKTGKKKGKLSAWYWFMVEHGTGGQNPQPERPFVRPVVDKISADMNKMVLESFTNKLAARIRRHQKAVEKGKA